MNFFTTQWADTPMGNRPYAQRIAAARVYDRLAELAGADYFNARWKEIRLPQPKPRRRPSHPTSTYYFVIDGWIDPASFEKWAEALAAPAPLCNYVNLIRARTHERTKH